MVEVDGAVHDADDCQADDRRRMEELHGRGLTVIRLTNEDVLCHLDETLRALAAIVRPRCSLEP